MVDFDEHNVGAGRVACALVVAHDAFRSNIVAPEGESLVGLGQETTVSIEEVDVGGVRGGEDGGAQKLDN